jgi:hypothetical protein
MQIQLQPNEHSCVITSVAMLLNVPIEELVQQIGHDGSELIHGTPRGHHIQEIIDLLDGLHCSLTPIQFEPEYRATVNSAAYPLKVREHDRLEQHLEGDGLLTGRRRNVGHCCAYMKGLVFDPVNCSRTIVYPIIDCALNNFFPTIFWKLNVYD